METIYHYTCVDVQDVPLPRIPETQVFAGAQGLIEVLILIRPSLWTLTLSR